MKGFIETLKNIWSVEELKGRILTTLGLLLVFRIGSYIILPGVDSVQLASAAGTSGGGIADLLSMFTGGAFSRASVFALGIMPYISASIIMQLMGIAVPVIQKMQKDGESGRRKVNQFTRLLTIAICVVQAPSYIATTVDASARPDSIIWWVASTIILTAGTLFVMWLGERITDRGIGNGISLLIMIGIISSLPFSFIQELVGRLGGQGGLVVFLVEIVILLLIVGFTILLVQGVRRIPVQFARRQEGGSPAALGARQYIPLKVNSSGVMPIIFAQAIMFVPLYLAQATGAQSTILVELANFSGFWYNFVFALMIVIFTYFYTAIMINPKQMADDMKRNGGFIPGIKPGSATEKYIDMLLSRITLPGSIFLALVAILPAFAIQFGVKQQFAIFFGGTSLLIMVGVVLDTLQQIESYLLSRHYDGLMESGKLKGRSGAFGVAS
jgi:preprotein translocase subunit SecY